VPEPVEAAVPILENCFDDASSWAIEIETQVDGAPRRAMDGSKQDVSITYPVSARRQLLGRARRDKRVARPGWCVIHAKPTVGNQVPFGRGNGREDFAERRSHMAAGESTIPVVHDAARAKWAVGGYGHSVQPSSRAVQGRREPNGLGIVMRVYGDELSHLAEATATFVEFGELAE
jgi:hypothetical protein